MEIKYFLNIKGKYFYKSVLTLVLAFVFIFITIILLFICRNEKFLELIKILSPFF